MNHYKTIDAHVAGEAVRLLVDGAPSVKGRTMDDKLAWMRKHGERLRRTLMLEPRGHAGMHGALFTEPVSPHAHAGLLSMHAGGFPLVSGEAVIAAVTIAVENNIIVFDRARTDEIFIDTPAGLLTARPDFLKGEGENDAEISGITLLGLPGFVHSAGVPVPFGKRSVRVDIAFGGEFYAIADSESIGIPVDVDHAPELLRTGLELKQAVESAVALKHPGGKKLSGLHGVMLTSAPREAGDLRSATILEGGVLRRSPGVTGTVALLAVLDAMGLVQDDQVFVHEGLVGTRLTGRVFKRQHVGEIPIVVPLIEGTAWMTGRHEFVGDADDPVSFRI